ncbi:MAG: FAD-dependent monooxygenase [Thioalkalivibrionaceae bacterium]
MRVNGTEHRCDVLVVGAGVVGLASAVALARAGLVVTLVSDRAVPHFDVAQIPARVSTLNDVSSRFLAELGLMPADPVDLDAYDTAARRGAGESSDVGGSPRLPGGIKRVGRVGAMQVWDARSRAEIRFESEPASPLAFTVEHSALEMALWEVAQTLGVVGRFGYRWRHFDPRREGPRVALEMASGQAEDSPDEAFGAHGRAKKSEVWCARWIVGADGARSGLRQCLGIPVRTLDDGTVGVVTTVSPEWCHTETAYQRFDGDDILALLPLYCGRVSIVWSRPRDAADMALAQTRQAFDAALTSASGGVLGSLRTLTTPRAWPIVRRHAQRYGWVFGRGGVLLAGDAAHTIHPLAGQGLNLGLADAGALTQCLLLACSETQSAQQTLIRYEAQRRLENALTAVTMESFKQLFSSRSRAVRVLRGEAVACVASSSAMRGFFRVAASGRLSGL